MDGWELGAEDIDGDSDGTDDGLDDGCSEGWLDGVELGSLLGVDVTTTTIDSPNVPACTPAPSMELQGAPQASTLASNV